MSATRNNPTATIARFIAQTNVQDIPAEAFDPAKKVIADTFAAILAGSVSEVRDPLARYVAAGDLGLGSAPILGTSRCAAPEAAALINGTYGAALEFDDVLSMMPGHPSAVIVPAICATQVGRNSSGRDVIAAYVIGIEVGSKIAAAMTIGHYHRGFHATGTVALFCAVAALAKLHQLSEPEICQAIGLASSLASGVQSNFGTMTKPLHSGWAARSAVAAVTLVGSEFTASPNALEGKGGYAQAYGVERSDLGRLEASLGRPWTVLDPGITLKYFPCCYATHRGIDGLLQLKDQLHLTPANVASVECLLPPGGLLPLRFDRPVTGLESLFSMPFALAAALLSERPKLATFKEEYVRSDEVAKALEHISVREDQQCVADDPGFNQRSPGTRGHVRVTATTTAGATASIRIDRPPGHPARPLTWEQLAAKFADCAEAAHLRSSARDEAFGLLRNLDKLDRLEHCIRLFADVER